MWICGSEVHQEMLYQSWSWVDCCDVLLMFFFFLFDFDCIHIYTLGDITATVVMKMAGFYFDFQRHSKTQSIDKSRIGGMITRYAVFWNFVICKSTWKIQISCWFTHKLSGSLIWGINEIFPDQEFSGVDQEENNWPLAKTGGFLIIHYPVINALYIVYSQLLFACEAWPLFILSWLFVTISVFCIISYQCRPRKCVPSTYSDVWLHYHLV